MNAPKDGKASAPSLVDFVALNEEIAALVTARIPLESHLAAAGRELRGKSGELAARLGQRMSGGESLAAAMDAEGGSLPATYKAVLEAGVESGQVGSALESIVASASRLDQLRRVTGAALLYPLMILIIACSLLAFVITKLVPEFAWVGQYRSAPLVWLSQWSHTKDVLSGYIPAAAIFVAAIWWWRSGRLSWTGFSQWGLLAWLPGTRSIRRWSEAAKFSELLLLLVERGEPLERSLRLAGEAAQDRRIRDASLRLADHTSRGDGDEPIAAELPLLIRLALKHRSDRVLLTGGLRQAAAIYHERAARAADWYAEYLPILLTAVIGGGITIGFALFLFWPYATMLRELSGYQWR